MTSCFSDWFSAADAWQLSDAAQHLPGHGETGDDHEPPPAEPGAEQVREGHEAGHDDRSDHDPGADHHESGRGCVQTTAPAQIRADHLQYRDNILCDITQ